MLINNKDNLAVAWSFSGFVCGALMVFVSAIQDGDQGEDIRLSLR